MWKLNHDLFFVDEAFGAGVRRCARLAHGHHAMLRSLTHRSWGTAFSAASDLKNAPDPLSALPSSTHGSCHHAFARPRRTHACNPLRAHPA